MIFGRGQKVLRTSDLKDRHDCGTAMKNGFPVILCVDTQLESNNNNFVILNISLGSSIWSFVVCVKFISMWDGTQ